MQTLAVEDDLQNVVTAMGQCPLFRSLRPEHLEQVAMIGTLHRFEPDEAIVREGEAADSFYVLLSGEAEVTLNQSDEDAMEIGRLLPPVSVGEVGLLLGEPRTASVIAVDSVTALRFEANAFTAMFSKIPSFGIGLSRGLADRLKKVSGLLPEYDANQEPPAPEVIVLLPMEFIQRHRVLPLKSEENVLTVGMVDDPTTKLMRALRHMLPGMEIRPVHIDLSTFGSVLGSTGGVSELTESRPDAVSTAATEAAKVGKSPLLDKLLERMVGEGASDVHLSAGTRPHWRIDGEMRAIADAAELGANDVYDLLEPVMDPRHREQFTKNDTDFAYALPGVARFRINMFRDLRGVGAVLRQIPSKVLTFEQLALPPVIKTFCDMPKGLVLVTGATGSGKSTTLAAMIDYINKTKKAHIITLEDPIEFVHQNQQCLINQREIGGHTVSFARALRAVLREDPDIVLVGELRDLETIALALEVANTGHLVFATLHTNSAISSVDRIIDLFPGDQQSQVRTVLADVIKGVISQSLLKKRGGGRIAAMEVLVTNYGIANLIREGKIVQIPNMMQAGKGAGNQMLNDELAKLVDRRKVDYVEALSKSVDKIEFAKRYGKTVTI